MHELGYTFRMSKRVHKWDDGAPFSSGWCHEYKKQIHVYVHGRPGHANVLHTIAHELRHAIHEKQGLYKDYYSLNFEMMRLAMRGQKVKWKWPNLGVAIRAERDCDRWADKWLKDRGITYIRKDIYAFESTMAYRNYKDMKAYAERVRVLQEKQAAQSIHETQCSEGRAGILLPGVQSGETQVNGELPIREAETVLEKLEQ